EAVACGSLLVTNDLRDNGQDELFRDGVHLATYRDADELLDKVSFYLRREEVRERIAAAGRAEALARHTYRHRMEPLLGATANPSPRPLPEAERGSRQTTPPFPSREGGSGGLGCAPDPRDPSYFEHARPELLALVPPDARKVLDIGCGAGKL